MRDMSTGLLDPVPLREVSILSVALKKRKSRRRRRARSCARQFIAER